MRMRSSYRVLMKWSRPENLDYVVKFLDPETKMPLCPIYVWTSPRTLIDTMKKSIAPLWPGPRLHTFLRQVEAGAGELEIEVTGHQYVHLIRKRTPRIPGAPPSSIM